jgi:hypothetical protein
VVLVVVVVVVAAVVVAFVGVVVVVVVAAVVVVVVVASVVDCPFTSLLQSRVTTKTVIIESCMIINRRSSFGSFVSFNCSVECRLCALPRRSVCISCGAVLRCKSCVLEV